MGPEPQPVAATIGGAIVGTVLIFGGIFVALFADFDANYPGRPPAPSGTASAPHNYLPLICWLMAAAAVWSLVTWLTWHRKRRFAIGMLIGLGTGLLLQGTCFVILSK